MPENFKLYLYIAFGFIFLNIVSLWIVFFAKLKPEESLVSETVETPVAQQATDSSAVSKTEFDLLTTRVIALESASPTVVTKKETVEKIISAPAATITREYDVYLGSGSTTNREWTDIDSAVAEINTSKYSNITKVIFQASLSIIGGEVQARVKNKTTGAIYHLTEITHNSSVSTWKNSQPFTLTTGNNQYIVQLKSSSSENAILDGARIKIEAN
jgi:hypothetical protein